MSKEINKKLTSPRLIFSVLGGCYNYFYSNVLTPLQSRLDYSCSAIVLHPKSVKWLCN